jgi:hypothetical protein
LPAWLAAVLGLALIRVLGALTFAGSMALPAPGRASSFPSWIFVIQIVAFTLASSWLLAGGRRDERALALAGVFLLIASAFSERLIVGHVRLVHPAFGVLLSLPYESLAPCCLWRFLAEFPRSSRDDRLTRIASAAAAVAALVGFLLLGVNLALQLQRADAPQSPLQVLSRSDPVGLYWVLLLILIVPALPLLLWRTARTTPEERQRVHLLVTGLVAGAGPVSILVFFESISSSMAEWMSHRGEQLVAGIVIYPCLLSIPFTTAYAVKAHHALDVRLIIRKAVRYALARWSLLFVMIAPFAFLAAYAYARRDETLLHILRGRNAVWALTLLAIGLAGLLGRRRVLEVLDRRFFREVLDARVVLSSLGDRIKAAADLHDLSRCLRAGLDRALHPDRIAVFVSDESSLELQSIGEPAAPLGATSELARLLSRSEAVEVDWEDPAPSVARLPSVDRIWLSDAGYRLLVPLVASDTRLLGLLALGEKKSELPYSPADRMLLSAVAGSVTLVLENFRFRSGGSRVDRERSATVSIDAARECVRCGSLQAADTARCARCGGELTDSPVPLVVRGLLKLEHRLGRGGMGVVYRAWDIELERPVALKTLPRAGPRESQGLRREARAMAAVSHSNLALIHGLESWRGTPILVLELMTEGTLADALRAGPLGVDRVLGLGLGLTGALRHLHERGILHRDIKPSNIGFVDGTPKLMDFGIARILASGTVHLRSLSVSPRSPQDPGSSRATTISAPDSSLGVAGTRMYMSPEALAGSPPDPGHDLWSLAVVLYEAIAGVHPWHAAGRNGGVVAAPGPVPAIELVKPDCPKGVSKMFERALSPDVRRRPTSSVQLQELLREAAQGLGR